MANISFEQSSGGIVYKKESDKILWLVICHTKEKHWGFPKGHIGDKVNEESLENAAIREVNEEGGVKAKIVHDNPVKTEYSFKRGKVLHKKTVSYFLMEYVEGDVSLHDKEVSDAKFVEESDLLDILTFDSDKKAFQSLKYFLVL